MCLSPLVASPGLHCMQGEQAASSRSVLGELQQNGASAPNRAGEDFDSWHARKQLQTKVTALQSRVKVRSAAELCCVCVCAKQHAPALQACSCRQPQECCSASTDLI